MRLPRSRCSQQAHWAFRDSDAVYTESCWWSCQLIPGNLLGGHLGAVLWSATPPPAPSLLQRYHAQYHHPDATMAAWVRQGRELLLLPPRPG